MLGAETVVGSFLPVATVMAAVLVAASVLVAHRVAADDRAGRRWITRVMVASAGLHLLCVPAQIWIVHHVYDNQADWVGYAAQAARLAANWRAGHFTVAGTGLHGVLGDGMVSIFGAAVMTVVGVNELAVFLLFAWLAFLGTVCFYRAFTVTFPGADHRRYALLVFFFPSLLFWTADLGKEAIITLSVGVAALGVARVLAHRPRGYLIVLLGVLIGIGVRPDELVLLAVAFAVAVVLRERDLSQPASGLRRAGGLVVAAGLTAGAGALTGRLLHAANGGTGVSSLSGLQRLNQGVGPGFGSSGVSYSSNPLTYPVDVYHVLFDPLPFLAHNVPQLLAGLENTVIIVVLLASLPSLRLVWRAGRHRPYVIVCLVYSLLFVYTFAALGNLGLITRERTLMLPFLLVITAIPVAGPEAAPHPWQLRRRARRAAGIGGEADVAGRAGGRVGADGGGPERWVPADVPVPARPPVPAAVSGATDPTAASWEVDQWRSTPGGPWPL